MKTTPMKPVAIACMILFASPALAADLPCVGATCVDNPMFKPAPGVGGVKAQGQIKDEAPADKPVDAKNASGANAKMK
jgi:hypothetical protein